LAFDAGVTHLLGGRDKTDVIDLLPSRRIGSRRFVLFPGKAGMGSPLTGDLTRFVEDMEITGLKFPAWW